jgi:UDP-glucose 4-epimerase
VKGIAKGGRQHRMPRILILGHTGFIGSHLTAHLKRELPEIEVIGRAPTSLDLTQENEARSLAKLFDSYTAVVMLAATKRQFGDNLDTYSRNVQMVINLCRLLQERPVARILYFSSAAVYGEDVHNTAITEETCVRPTSYYGAAKYAAECLLRKVFSTQPESSLLVLRPPLIYGPGDHGETYGPSGFVRAVIRGAKITLWGDGTEMREFIFVEDLVRIVTQLIFHEASGVVNVASGAKYTFRGALDIALALAPRQVEVASRPRTKRSVDNAFCNERLLELLPQFAFTALESGMRQTYEIDRLAVTDASAADEGGLA